MPGTTGLRLQTTDIQSLKSNLTGLVLLDSVITGPKVHWSGHFVHLLDGFAHFLSFSFGERSLGKVDRTRVRIAVVLSHGQPGLGLYHVQLDLVLVGEVLVPPEELPCLLHHVVLLHTSLIRVLSLPGSRHSEDPGIEPEDLGSEWYH